MFNPFRTLPTRAVRKHLVGAAVESLETRCLFSVAPLTLPAAAPDLTLLHADSERYSALLQAGSLDHLAARPIAPLVPSLPGNSEPPSIGTWGPLRPDQVPDARWPAGGQPLDLEPQRPNGTPPDTEPGGLIDLFNLPGTNAPLQDNAPAPEAHEVLRMLESLSYLPDAAAAEASGARTADVPATDRAAHLGNAENSPLTRGAGTNDPPSHQTRGAGIGSPALDHEGVDGGLITLRTDAEIKQTWAPQPEALNTSGSLLEVPLEMDAAYGKFHAFEVSTAEPEPSPAIPQVGTPDSSQLPLKIDIGDPMPHTDQPATIPPAELLTVVEAAVPAEDLTPPVPRGVESTVRHMTEDAVAVAVDLIMTANAAQAAWYPAVGALYAGYLMILARDSAARDSAARDRCDRQSQSLFRDPVR